MKSHTIPALTLFALLVSVCLVVAQEATKPNSARNTGTMITQWEYSTFIAYNWVPEAYQRGGDPAALTASHILNIGPKLAQMGEGGWELSSITPVASGSSADVRARSERFVVVFKRPKTQK